MNVLLLFSYAIFSKFNSFMLFIFYAFSQMIFTSPQFAQDLQLLAAQTGLPAHCMAAPATGPFSRANPFSKQLWPLNHLHWTQCHAYLFCTPKTGEYSYTDAAQNEEKQTVLQHLSAYVVLNFKTNFITYLFHHQKNSCKKCVWLRLPHKTTAYIFVHSLLLRNILFAIYTQLLNSLQKTCSPKLTKLNILS